MKQRNCETDSEKAIRKEKKSNKRGFSEKLYALNFLFVWGYMISIFWLTVKSGSLGIMDLNSYASAAPYAFGELGIHTGFIVWKAKVENCRKYKDVNGCQELESEVVTDAGIDVLDI